MPWRSALLICLILAASSRAQSGADDKYFFASQEALLKKHQLPTSGAALLKFFQERTPTKEQIAQFQELALQLNAEGYGDRLKAANHLGKQGSKVKWLLMDLVRDSATTMEARRRAEVCLRQIHDEDESALANAAAALIARDKPAGAAPILLSYLPYASDDAILEGLQRALNAVAVVKKEPHPAVLAALKDAHAGKRAAAAEALIRAGGLAHKPAVMPLVEDKNPQVRWQVVRALVEARDKEAVPKLIELFDDVRNERLWQLEDLLSRVAGDKAPGVYVDNVNSPDKVQKAWTDWWDKNQNTLSLAKFGEAPQLHGYTLVTQMVPGAGLNGKIIELRPNKEVHFEIAGLRYPLDAQIIGRDRILIAEYFSRRVTERDFKGNILWEKPADMPIACQRLPNGHTFIGTRRQLMVVDRAGKEVVNYFHPTTSISAATRLRDGQMALVNAAGTCVVLDAQGREVKQFHVGQVYSMGGNLDVLAGGRLLVPLYRENRIVDVDLEGKVHAQVSLQYPVSAVRLPNGNTLAVSQTDQRVIELDPQGREVWACQVEGRPWRARKR